MRNVQVSPVLGDKLNAQVWVQGRVVISGKLVSIIGSEWFNRVDVVLSSRPLKGNDGEWADNQLEQTVRYLERLTFGPYQNIARPDYEAAVSTAAEKLKGIITRFQDDYSRHVKDGKTHFVFGETHDEFNIIISVLEG